MEESLLKLILEGEGLSSGQMAEILQCDKAAIEEAFKKLKETKTLLGWRPVLHPNFIAQNQVRAVIEVKITPEGQKGFDRIAERISNFVAVESCYLMSGDYELMVIVKGNNLQTIASFVSEKLAPLQGVISTATHFLLRCYKEQGYRLKESLDDPDRPVISP